MQHIDNDLIDLRQSKVEDVYLQSCDNATSMTFSYRF